MTKMKQVLLAVAAGALSLPFLASTASATDICEIECTTFDCWVYQQLFCPRNVPKAAPRPEGN